MEPKTFWKQYDLAEKEHEKWEKRADKVVERFRLDEIRDGSKEGTTPSFNILWANTAVMQPSLFSQVPKPDIRRRYRDDDPVAKQGAKVIERALEFVMDDGDFYSFGYQTAMDFLLPGRSVPKIRYVPLYSKVRRAVELDKRTVLSPLGEPIAERFYNEEDEVDPAEVRFQEGSAFLDVEVEEVVDEHVVIERWPWKNFRHQKAKRWQEVGWVDYISYLNREQLKKHFGAKAKDIKLTVDASGDKGRGNSKIEPTHAEVHEIWFLATRTVKIAVRDGDEWLKEGGDPLRLRDFYPMPRPVFAVNTNDSLMPIPVFTLYQHQANELDLITRRISVLMRALKLAGLYAGNEKETLRKLFESDENQMIPVADWGAIQASGGISGLVDWLPVEQVGKVLSALFREREAIIQQIFELTGIADIQRGSTDPRETRGAQQLKAQFASRRSLTPKQEIERYFRDCLRISAEIMSEHFDTQTLERMTGLQIPQEVEQLLKNELDRQYRIDIETDSTVAPDEAADQANMAKAMEALTAYLGSVFPLTQAGIPAEPLIALLKVCLRKFRWGREIEEMLEELERNPPQPQPDPEQQKMQAEMQMKQQDQQMKMQELQADMQAKQAEMQMKLQEMQASMQIDAAKAQQDMIQDQQEHDQEMRQDQEKHLQDLQQARELARAKTEATRAQAVDSGQSN
jgi:hypothetical protein